MWRWAYAILLAACAALTAPSAQTLTAVTFVWDVDSAEGWPAAAAQIERNGAVEACGPITADSATTYRCTMAQPPGTYTFRVRGLSSIWAPGAWSAGVMATVPGTPAPSAGTATIVRLYRLQGGTPGMAFANIGSAESIFASVNSASDTVSGVAVPDLGADRVGVVLVQLVTSISTVNGVTWNGDAMTAGPAAANGNHKTAIYYLIGADDNGSYDIVVSYAASAIHSAQVVVAWADADGTITLDTSDTATGTGAASVALTLAAANEWMLSSSASAANDVPGSYTDCAVLQSYDQGGNTAAVASSTPAGSGSVTHAHNYGGADNYAAAALAFASAGGGGAVPHAPFGLMLRGPFGRMVG